MMHRREGNLMNKPENPIFGISRRQFLAAATVSAVATLLPYFALSAAPIEAARNRQSFGEDWMKTFAANGGTTIHYKDWSIGQPVVFSHGWPLNADAWDTQMLYLKDLSLPFHGYNTPGAKIAEGIRGNFSYQGRQGGIKGQYDCIKVFSEIDYTEDLKNIGVPTLVMHGDDDQIVPFADTGARMATIVKKARLTVYLRDSRMVCQSPTQT